MKWKRLGAILLSVTLAFSTNGMQVSAAPTESYDQEAEYASEYESNTEEEAVTVSQSCPGTESGQDLNEEGTYEGITDAKFLPRSAPGGPDRG